MRNLQRFPILRLSIFAALLLAAACAHAQLPKFDAFVGYSQATDSGVYGWEAALNVKVAPFVGIEGDVGGYGYGRPSTDNRSYLYLFGPRVTVSASKLKLFAHALGGRLQNSGGISPTVDFYTLSAAASISLSSPSSNGASQPTTSALPASVSTAPAQAASPPARSSAFDANPFGRSCLLSQPDYFSIAKPSIKSLRFRQHISAEPVFFQPFRLCNLRATIASDIQRIADRQGES